jgi:flagellin
MVSALSSQQLSALGGLLDLNSTMSDLQNRVSTGKKINSVFDDPTKFLLAGRLNDRADALLATNKQMDFGMTAITSAQKALSKIKTDFTNAIGDLKTLKGLTETTGAAAYNPTNAAILGEGKVISGELGAVTTSGTDLQRTLGGSVGQAAITANKRVFGAQTAASNTNNGAMGVTMPAGTTSLRVVIGTAGNNGAAFNAAVGGATTVSLDITASDVGDGTGNLANLTVADVVKKINANSPTFGGSNRLTADVNANGQITFGSTTGVGNFRVQIGAAISGTTAANTVAADMNAAFGLAAITGTGAQAAAATFTSTSRPSTAERGTVPPAIATRILTDSARAVFDGDGDSTNNGPGYSAASGFTSGNVGVPYSTDASGTITSSNTLTVAVKAAGGTAVYLDVTASDLSGAGTPPNTLAGLATALNDKARTAGLTNFDASIDPLTKQLTIKSGVGSTIGIGTAATAPLAQANADQGTANTAFGLASGGAVASFTTAAPSAADASAVSLLGNTLDSFQDGDTFKISVKNTSNPNDTREIYFQATAAGNVPTSFTSTSGTNVDPYKFNNMQQLSQAITTAFNATQLAASATKVSGTGTGTVATQFQLNMTLGANFSMDIEQVTNAVGGVATSPAGADSSGVPNVKNAANAIERIFGQRNDTAAGGIKTSLSAESLLTTIDMRDSTGKLTGREQDYGKKVSYSRIAAAAAQNGDAKRASVNENLTKMLGQIAGVVTDSQVSGQPNVLNGAALTLQLSEKGDRSTTIQLATAVTTDNLGFTQAVGGGAGFALLQGLGTDTDVNSALSAFTAAVSSLDSMSYTLGSQGASIVSWQNFNSSLSTALTTSATGMVSTDTTADSVQLQALSTRYSLATSALGLLNQASQSAVQLLR